MTIIGLLLFLAAAALAIRWWMYRFDAMGRPRSFPMLSVILLVVLGGGAVTPGILRARLERRLSAVASKITGADVKVDCQTFGQQLLDVGAEGGFVAFLPDGTPEHKALIKRDFCRALSAYIRSDKSSPTSQQVQAVHILTHESIHMSGVTSESHTECLAVQRDAETARLLGASDEQARSLARDYWTSMYPRLWGEYRSEECRAGGRLDAGLPDAPWSQADS